MLAEFLNSNIFEVCHAHSTIIRYFMEVTCHCNNVTITVDKPTQITQCNCSICSRYMSLWGYYAIGSPKIEIGDFGTHAYTRGAAELRFMRCANCGCVTHYQTNEGHADPRIAINFALARTQVADVQIRYFDGADSR